MGTKRPTSWIERTLVPFRLTFVPSWVKLDDLRDGAGSAPPAPPGELRELPAQEEGHRCLRPELPRAA